MPVRHLPVDGTAFSSINSGLIDRFQKQILPAPNFPNPVQEEKIAEKAQEEDIDSKFQIFWGVRIKDVLFTSSVLEFRLLKKKLNYQYMKKTRKHYAHDFRPKIGQKVALR